MQRSLISLQSAATPASKGHRAGNCNHQCTSAQGCEHPHPGGRASIAAAVVLPCWRSSRGVLGCVAAAGEGAGVWVDVAVDNRV